jgi:hypothetical protein
MVRRCRSALDSFRICKWFDALQSRHHGGCNRFAGGRIQRASDDRCTWGSRQPTSRYSNPPRPDGTNTDPHPYAYTNPYASADRNSYSYIHAYAYSYGYIHTYPNSYCDIHTDCDCHIYA